MTDHRPGHEPDPVLLREGYERLRERVLAGCADGWRLGHALLARQGVAGWIAAHETAAAGDAAMVQRRPEPDAVAAPADDCAQIVAVLAEMALAHAA